MREDMKVERRTHGCVPGYDKKTKDGQTYIRVNKSRMEAGNNIFFLGI
jgi:hypothetical protein